MMMSKSDFLSLTTLLKRVNILPNSSEISIPLTEHDNKETISLSLKELGYEDDLHRNNIKGTFRLSLHTERWDIECPIYDSWEALFNKVNATSSIPKNYYIIEDKASSFDDSINSNFFKLFCLGRRLLAELADHCEPTKGNAKGSKNLVFIIETENSVSKHEFKPTIDFKSLLNISNLDKQLTAFNNMLNTINLPDNKDLERKNILRSSLSELLSDFSNNEKLFEKIISLGHELNNKFNNQYELYLKKFSVNKTLKEINDQDLNYTSKINEIVSSTQNKALTIPGTLIAIGAIMNIDHYSDGLAILLGLLITSIIVYRSLNVHESTIEHLKKQVESDFKRYDNLNEETEVKAQAKITNAALLGLLEKANKNSSFMKNCIKLVFTASIIYIGLTVSNIDSRKPVNLYISQTASL